MNELSNLGAGLTQTDQINALPEDEDGEIEDESWLEPAIGV